MTEPAHTAPGLAPAGDPLRRKARMHIEVQHFHEPTRPETHTLFTYHARCAAEGSVIRRTDIPNPGIAAIMPGIYMLAPAGPPEDPNADWRFRLVGTRICTRLQIDPTNVCISELLDEAQFRHHAQAYTEIARGDRLTVTRGHIRGLGRDYLRLEMAHVPMLAADGITRCVLGVMAFLS